MSAAPRQPAWPAQEPPEAVTDAQRLGALDATGLLDSPPEPTYDRLTALALRLLDVPVALISLVDADRQFFKSAQGLCEPWSTARGTPLSHSFCQHVVGSSDVLVIDDAREHPLVRDNAAVADLNVIGYLGVPLLAPDGQVLGSFCAIDSKPRRWTPQEVADLSDLAAVAAVEIAARQKLQARARSEQQLQVLTGELDHRIRNLLGVVQAIAQQTGARASSVRAFLDAFQSRLQALASTHTALIESRGRSASLERIARAALGPYLGDGRVELDLGEREVESCPALALALVFHELATNALKHGALSSPEGRVTLSAEREQGVDERELVLVWREHGGPPVRAPARQGFGTRMLTTIAQQHGGAAELDWHADGLICRLRLAAG